MLKYVRLMHIWCVICNKISWIPLFEDAIVETWAIKKTLNHVWVMAPFITPQLSSEDDAIALWIDCCSISTAFNLTLVPYLLRVVTIFDTKVMQSCTTARIVTWSSILLHNPVWYFWQCNRSILSEFLYFVLNHRMHFRTGFLLSPGCWADVSSDFKRVSTGD